MPHHYNNGGRGNDNEDCDEHDGSPNWWPGDQVSDWTSQNAAIFHYVNMSAVKNLLVKSLLLAFNISAINIK